MSAAPMVRSEKSHGRSAYLDDAFLDCTADGDVWRLLAVAAPEPRRRADAVSNRIFPRRARARWCVVVNVAAVLHIPGAHVVRACAQAHGVRRNLRRHPAAVRRILSAYVDWAAKPIIHRNRRDHTGCRLTRGCSAVSRLRDLSSAMKTQRFSEEDSLALLRGSGEVGPRVVQITPRELELLQLLANGESGPAAAVLLAVNPGELLPAANL